MRGFALSLSVFALFNVLIGLLRPGFDVTGLWLHTYGIPHIFSVILVSCGALAMLLRRRLNLDRPGLRWTVGAPIAILALLTLGNAVGFYFYWWSGRFTPAFFVPLSIGFAAITGHEAFVVFRRSDADRAISWVPVVAGVIGFMIAFPLAQVFLFGKSDYSRRTDAVVVLGARVYRDGRPSDALKDRVNTAVDLYQRGLVRTMIFSGGPGDGAVHETEAMKALAQARGVPGDAILCDRRGVNTEGTVEGTLELMRRHGIRSLMAVSHFYHLPRIKMAFARRGVGVYTVPARETYRLSKLPVFIAREIPALMYYWIKPAFGG